MTPYRTIYNELYNINTEQDLDRTSTGKSKSKSKNRRNMSKSAQGTFKNTSENKNTGTTDTRNNKMTRSKHSVQLSDSTAVQSAVTKSTRITGRTFKFKKESNNRYNATTDDRTSKSPGLSESRKLENVSIFENDERASSLDKEIARIAARTSPAVNLGYKSTKRKT